MYTYPMQAWLLGRVNGVVALGGKLGGGGRQLHTFSALFPGCCLILCLPGHGVGRVPPPKALLPARVYLGCC